MSATSDAVAWHSQIAARFDARYASSAAFRERLAVWSELIPRYCAPASAALDAGCGSGVLTMVAARTGARVIGFDASPEMLAIAQERALAEGAANVELRNARLPDLAFLGGRRFDLVMASSVLEYMDDLWQTIDALAAHVAPGGVLLVSLPNGASAYRWLERISFALVRRPRYFATVKHVPNPGTITDGLTARGLTVEEVRYYAPTPLLSRPMRQLGLARHIDHLFVVAARKAPE